MSIKQKTVSGLFWSFIDSIARFGIQFIVGILLARLLSPKEFGLIGMVTIFIAISQSFIDSGFSQALIRKKDPSQADYSTVFYFNILVGVVCFFILFICADPISRFFKEPQLKLLVKVLGLSLIINAFTIIQQTILTKRIDFKLQAKISIISSIVSGAAGLIMAYFGFGVWSLVIKTVSMYVISTTLLWLWNRWKPDLVFSIKSFKELFSFGSKLLMSGLLNTAYSNVYYLVIGKYFSARELGYYTRAELFKTLPSLTLTEVIQRVSYPVLSGIREDLPQLKEAYKKLIRSTMLICFVLMLGMAAIARPMILTLVGEKWEPSVIYLQMLCFVGMFFPLHALNLNMLQVKGRSDLFLRLEIIKVVLVIPVIVIGVILGIRVMILGMLIRAMISYYLDSYWSGRLIGYSFLEQIRDIIPSFLIAAAMAAAVFAEGLLIPLPPLQLLVIQLITGALLTFTLCEVLHNADYLYIKEIIKDKFF